MCGIAGILSNRTSPDSRQTLVAMTQAIAHRGPDGSGHWHDPAQRVWLGHRRLSVIDLDGGTQPMSNEDSSIQIVFNGCIYNYQDLARELRALGHRFSTHCDTEVIVHAYEQWGEKCVERFNGMWAFALWDSRRNRLFCSRDRLGIKPFYFNINTDRFVFASEIKSLLAVADTPRCVDPLSLRQYLTFQLCLGSNTLFSSISRLLPGCNLLLEPGGDPVIQKYWDIHFAIEDYGAEDDAANHLRGLLRDAVRSQLVSDVPLGAHLSGGLDSSSVACLARSLLGEGSLDTFTGKFDLSPEFDESSFARVASDAAKSTYHEIALTHRDFIDSISRIIYHMDEPTAGPGVFPQFHVSRLAAQHVKVVLGGQGGDELFIGYARYLIAYLEECLRGAIFDTAHRARYVTTLETIVPSLPTLEQYVPMLKGFWQHGIFEEPARRYFALMDRSADARSMFHPDALPDPEESFVAFRDIFEHHEAASNINRIMYFDLKTHLQALLHVEDRTSMAWGLESRVPLLDHRLVEFMTSVTPAVKFRNGSLKYLFRRAVEPIVPRQIFDRKDKMGFPVPLNQWIKGPLRDFVADILRSKASRERGILNADAIDSQLFSSGQFGRGVWGALCLELWHQQFIDKPPIPRHTDGPAASLR